MIYRIICAIFLTELHVCYANGLLDTYQLPLSLKILKSFPKIKSSHFIIAVPKLGIVLHECKSQQQIRCGSFSQTLYSMAVLAQSKLDANVDKFLTQYGRTIPNYTDIASQDAGILVSLYELCNIFEQEYLYIIRNCNIISLSSDVKLLFFVSKKNIGCICRVKNTNNVIFDVIVYSQESKTEILQDLNNIIKWLNKFTIKEVQSNVKKQIYIPVFYGTHKHLKFSSLNGHLLLVEKDKTEQIIKTVRYLMRIVAPVEPTTQIGWVFYKYSLFKHPIRYNIYSKVSIKKSNIFKNIVDSISYIVYNRPYNN